MWLFGVEGILPFVPLLAHYGRMEPGMLYVLSLQGLTYRGTVEWYSGAQALSIMQSYRFCVLFHKPLCTRTKHVSVLSGA